jgi:DNA replication and repair protein RecF
MYIQSLELNHFRNYDNLNIVFDKHTNILYGDNAQGKTNVLESIYIAATTKSHRGNKDKEMIMFHQDEAHIKLMILKHDVPLRIDMHLKKNKAKGIAINGIPIRKASELFGIFNVVFFSPEDLNIIKNGPSERRKFIDMELCQLDKVYVHDLISYNKILNQRNKLLKDISFSGQKELMETLDVWDMQLAEYGEHLIQGRGGFIERLNDIIRGIHGKITNDREYLMIQYEPDVESGKMYQELVSHRERDLRLGSTTAGPHRDDIGFYNQTMDLRKYGSQGQQRTAALSLKLSEIELVKEQIKDVPVLLLDDVLSELDSKRQKNLLDGIEGVQTIITCTGLDEFIENRFEINSVYKVTDGTIERSSNE